MMSRRLTLSAIAGAVMAISGCTMAPTYERPATPIPVASSEGLAPFDLNWRTLVLDPRIQAVVATALDSNRELQVSLLQVEKARTQYRIQGAAFWPTIGASITHSALSDDSRINRDAVVQVGITSWELDLFGRVASLKLDALGKYLASEQTGRAARISIVSEVVSRWLELAAAQQYEVLSAAALDIAKERLNIALRQQKAGVGSLISINSEQQALYSALKALSEHKAAREQAYTALELSVGHSIDPKLLPLEEDIGALVALAPVPAELHSDMLLRRPDVMAAEFSLKGANANIGAARAAFFPSISLTATTGRASDSLDSLVNGDRTWSFIPSISVPIFQAGALKASLDAAEIQKNIHVAQYERSIQVAFKEVADVISTHASTKANVAVEHNSLKAATQTYELTTERFKAGVSSKQETLSARLSVIDTQKRLLSASLIESLNRMAIYKTLGGEQSIY